MRKKSLSLFAGIAAIFAIFTFADNASSQTLRESRGRLMTKDQVKSVISRVEDRVDNFVNNFDKALDRSRLNGSNREDWLNRRAKDLEHATDVLRSEFDRRDAWIENKDEVRTCLNIATDIDRNIRKNRFGGVTESNWARVRFELNSLADVYNLPRVGSGVYR